MAEPNTPLPEDQFLLAGAHVLGSLEGQEHADAQRLLLSDRRFADAVAWWENRLGAMCEVVSPIEPSARTWQAIDARIRAQNDNEPHASSDASAKPSKLSLVALATGAGLAVASLVLFVATPRADQDAPAIAEAPAPAPQLIAQIEDAEAGRRIASVIDPARERIALTIEGLDADEGFAPELWVIPQGGAPVSLGAIPEEGRFERDLDEQEAGLLAQGATLAVTFEEATGQRHEAPTPPILLAGVLDEV